MAWSPPRHPRPPCPSGGGVQPDRLRGGGSNERPKRPGLTAGAGWVGNKALFPNLRRHPTPYAKGNVFSGGNPRGSASLGHESLDDLDNTVLLASGKFLNLLKHVAHLAAGGGGASRLVLAEQLLDGDAEGLGYGD